MEWVGTIRGDRPHLESQQQTPGQPARFTELPPLTGGRRARLAFKRCRSRRLIVMIIISGLIMPFLHFIPRDSHDSSMRERVGSKSLILEMEKVTLIRLLF